MNNKNPKYDNDFVTLGYLKNSFNESNGKSTDLSKYILKSYSSPPTPPYRKGSILYYEHCVFRCNKDRLQGVFDINDWSLVATDSDDFNQWVEYIYSIDKLNLENQIDNKIETYYQDSDPNDWSTDLEKAKHVGDYWYKTTDNTQWRWSRLGTNPITYAWMQVNIPTAVFDLIDTKKSIYTSKPTSYKRNDLWIIEETLSDNDLPVGTQENPITKGDWVFATTDSDSYNKNHWVKRDTDVNLEYLQAHYYTVSEIEAITTEIDEETDQKILVAKGEINLNISEHYTSKTEFNQKVLDYDEEIGEINSSIEEHGERITDIDMGVDEIRSTVSNNYIETKRELNNFASSESVINIQNRVTQIQTDTYSKTQVDSMLIDGTVKKVQTASATYDESGMTYEKSDAETKTKINEIGVNVKKISNDKTILFAGYVDENNSEYSDYQGQTIVATDNIIVENYLVVGSHSRFENYETGTGCFYVGG